MPDTEPNVTVEFAKQLGLTDEQFEQIKNILGRSPSYTELQIFVALWSERHLLESPGTWLKSLLLEEKALLYQQDEELSSLINLDEDWVCNLRLESYAFDTKPNNLQGTGSGIIGTLTNILKFGTQPLACLHSSQAGTLVDKQSCLSVKKLVTELSNYSNYVGIPMLGGEVYFDESYRNNPIVNLLTLGLAEHSQILAPNNSNLEDPIFIVGAPSSRESASSLDSLSEAQEVAQEDLDSYYIHDTFQEEKVV